MNLTWRSTLGFESSGLRCAVQPGRFNVYLAETELHSIIVLAERLDNPGGSVTNAYEAYARSVCQAEEIDPERAVFFELYLDPGRVRRGRIPVEIDGVSGGASLDQVRPDFDNEDTRWLPGQGDMCRAIWQSLAEQCDLMWSYHRPNTRRHTG